VVAGVSVCCASKGKGKREGLKMGPPPAAGEEKIVVLKAVGGEIGSASSLAPKLGPLGLVSIGNFILF
jgi:hypothetical protein